ncbi:glucose-1-phosphate adenylyltransferase subunit GlgD [Aneurinibacillus terranovensis]|uniref:glucose-1-phosphate adenylyltransferase subunit GlgD n=1 Tax=Aneurinibacillus terranovensis TaxID=278991 RepID=UPI0003FEE080|nr:glucose-1-phosphate adenylyltransferase subunit GlgD [Aneurinibacillus terranovensis]
MEQVMGVINLGNEFDRLNELTYFRCPASVPFGGRYRMIDFTLSNMVNSGIRDAAVLTLHKYRSLMDHLGTGKEWDLARKRGGLFILPPAFDVTSGVYKGDLQNFLAHLDFFRRGSQKYVLIAGSQIICNIDYCQPFLFHQNVGADITVLYKKIDPGAAGYEHCKRLEIGEGGRITAMETADGMTDSGKADISNVFMDMFLIEKSLLVDIIQTCVSQGKYDFLKDGISNYLNKLGVYGYEYQGYMAPVYSVQDYYRNSMNLLDPGIWNELFLRRRLIYTKVKDEPPVEYLEGARVENSLVANGCVIEGEVENSILFRGVKVRKGARIKNSIILQHCDIEPNARIEHAIMDKDASLTGGRMLAGTLDHPLVVAKRMVV